MLLVLLSSLLFANVASATPGPVAIIDQINGKDLITGTAEALPLKREGDKATVVVFLSTKCMCSPEQLMNLKDLAKSKYVDQAKFVAVNVDAFDPEEKLGEYYKALGLGIPVIRDEGLKLARAFKVQKTPHAFLLDAQGKIVFEGGVSDNKDDKEMPYLANALEDFTKKRPLRKSKAVTFGCVVRYEPIPTN